MAGVGAPWPVMRELVGEGREGEGEGERGARLGAPWGEWGGVATRERESVPVAPCGCSLVPA
jgi:hypothetical protein